MQAELERASPTKVHNDAVFPLHVAESKPLAQLIWFLAPHVELATQQAKAIATQIPSVQTRLLIGADGVEHWKAQWIWDKVLDGIQIVISTHQVGKSLQARESFPFLNKWRI